MSFGHQHLLLSAEILAP